MKNVPVPPCGVGPPFVHIKPLDGIQDVVLRDISLSESEARLELDEYFIKRDIAFIDFPERHHRPKWPTVWVLPVAGLQRPLLPQARDRQDSGTRFGEPVYSKVPLWRDEYEHEHQKLHSLQPHRSRLGLDDQDGGRMASSYGSVYARQTKSNWSVRFLPAHPICDGSSVD